MDWQQDKIVGGTGERKSTSMWILVLFRDHERSVRAVSTVWSTPYMCYRTRRESHKAAVVAWWMHRSLPKLVESRRGCTRMAKVWFVECRLTVHHEFVGKHRHVIGSRMSSELRVIVVELKSVFEGILSNVRTVEFSEKKLKVWFNPRF